MKTFRSPLQKYDWVQLSPNNDFILASQRRNSDAWVLKSRSGELAFALKGHSGYIECESYSPDGQWIATGAQDSTAILWNAKDGTPIRRFIGHTGIITALAFSSDGKWLATLSYDKTAKIWETSTGNLLKTLQIDVRHEIGNEIHFSPNGKLISVKCLGYFNNQEQISLWSTETGENVRDLEGYSFCFSPDGKWVCLFKEAKAFVYAADRMDEEPFRTFQATFPPLDGPMPTSILNGAFLPDSKGIFLNAWHIPEVYDLETGKHRLSLKGYVIPVKSVSFSPDSRQCLFGTEVDILKLDFTAGDFIKRFKGQGGLIDSRYSPDGRNIISITEDCTGTISDADNGEPLFQLEQTPCTYPISSYARILEVSPDGQYFVRGHGFGNKAGPPMLGIYQFSNEGIVDSLLFPFEEFGEPEQVAISMDGKQIAVLAEAKLLVWDVNMRQWDVIFDEHQYELGSIAFYGKDKLAICWGDQVMFWDITQKQSLGATWLKEYYLGKKDLNAFDWMGTSLEEANLSDIACSQNGKWLATAYGNDIVLWRCAEDKLPEPVHVFKGHDNSVTQIHFSSDSRFLISSSLDNTVRIWEVQKQVEAARVIVLDDYHWVITTPSGLFDASDGARKMMYYVVDYQKETVVIGLEQLQERYWQPGLLASILGLSPYPVRNVGTFDNLPLFPSIEESTRIESDHLHIRLRERNGGIGKLNLIINGITRAEDLNPERNKELKIDLKRFSRFLRTDTVNTIELEVYEAKNSLKSGTYLLHYQVSVQKRGEGNEEAPIVNDCQMPRHLYLIVVGTSLYPQGVDSLPSANEDALEMARVLQEAGKQLYDDRVHLKLLATRGGESPSKANIAAAFEAFKSASVCDVLVVFFAGHGSNWGKDGDKSNFYYLTQDITFNKLNDEGIRKAYAISDQELKDWMREIPAENKLLILDACNSGQAAINMGGVIARDMDPDKIVAFNIMSGNSGSYVISGSSESGASFESVVFGHGLLTYSLLEGINGTALDGTKVDVLPLLLKSYKRVGELAKTLGKEQTPIIAKPRGNASFYVGRNDGNIKIDLPETKPMVIRSIFFEQGTFSDQLSLTKSVNAAFRGKEIRGKQAPWFYSDIPEHPQGFTVRGAYTSQPDKSVSVRCSVLKGETPVGEPFTVNGPNDSRALSELIVKAARPLIRLK